MISFDFLPLKVTKVYIKNLSPISNNQSFKVVFHDLISVLKEVEDSLDTCEYDDLPWAGDWNWDPSRRTGFSEEMRRFLDRLGLSSVWDYTHIHTDLR